jgi:predicted GNAT family acetyltransferase
MADEEIVYSKLDEKTVDDVLNGLAVSFANHETLGKCLKIVKEDMLKTFSALLPNTFKNSFVVTDKSKNNKVIGAIICLDFLKTLNHEPDENNNLTSTVFDDITEPIHSILSQLEEKYIADKKASNEFKENNILYQYATYVDNEYNGRGIGTKLYQLSEQNAIDDGFKYLVTISTGPYSQHIRKNKLHFTKLYQTDYQTFEYNGKKVFSDITTTPGCMLFEKKL